MKYFTFAGLNYRTREAALKDKAELLVHIKAILKYKHLTPSCDLEEFESDAINCLVQEEATLELKFEDDVAPKFSFVYSDKDNYKALNQCIREAISSEETFLGINGTNYYIGYDKDELTAYLQIDGDYYNSVDGIVSKLGL